MRCVDDDEFADELGMRDRDIPCNCTTPIMGHHDAVGIPQICNELGDVLHDQSRLVGSDIRWHVR